MMSDASRLICRLAVLLGGLLLAAATLLLLRARDRRVERREAKRLARLADASSRLVRMRQREDVLASLLATIPDFVASRDVIFEEQLSVTTSESKPRQLRMPLVNDAGEVLGMVSLDLLRRPDPGDMAALRQLVESATAALETIYLLKSAEASRLRTETILSSMSDAMLALDRHYCLTFLNRNAATLLGGSREALLGRQLFDLLPPDAEPELREELQRLVATDQEGAVRLHWPPAHDERRRAGAWVMARAFQHADGLTLYMQDITRQVETEEQLRQTAKMEAIGQLTGGIAHDFNNLLTVMLGNLETLEEIVASDSLASELVNLAQRAGRSAAGLTARLLAFARRQPLAPTDIDVGALATRLGALLRRTLAAGIDIRIDRGPKLWSARADAGQLENAILNLAINARDAMKGTGRLTLRLLNRVIEPDDLAGELAPGDYAEISLVDTGCGIEPDILARVFEPFFTTKPAGAGTGLGLSMVYGFAKQSGGTVALESEPGRGTVARLLLPRGRGPVDSDPTFRAQVALPRGQGQLILVVEDTALVRRFVVNVLQDLGYVVTAVRDGPAAVRALATGPAPDLVVSDVALPGGLDGQDVVRAARDKVPSMPIIFMSGNMNHDLLNKVLLDRRMSFISKPFRRADLAVHVHRQLAPETHVGRQPS